MRNNELCVKADDCSSVRDVISKASILLKSTGHNNWAKEMNERIEQAKKTEEIFDIIEDYVEII